MRKQKGFTLVELLVVIAIIAVLMAILIPALSNVKNQARILLCAANCKQIGAIMGAYQADNDGYVPVMRNRSTQVDAKSAFLSIPFRKYSGAGSKLPTWLPPDQAWNAEMILDYADNYLPDFYVCPFARGKAASLFVNAGTVVIAPGHTRINYKSTGRMDSYSTWIWPRPAGYDFWPGEHPWGPPNGYNKFENVVWHRAGSPDGFSGEPFLCRADSASPDDIKWMKENPRKLSNAPRISKRTAVYCATGEIDESLPHNFIWNYRSHKRQDRGGTNVVFGDSHVEWVQGSQMTAGN